MIPSINFCPQCGTALARLERYGKPRPVCPQCDYVHFFDPKVGAGVFITEDDGPGGPRVLLIQRNPEADGAGLWALPAGFVEGREDPAQTAIREALEETGLHVRLTGLRGVFHNHEGRASIMIVYGAAVTDGQLCAGDDAAAAAWFRPGALPPLAFASTQTLVAAWQHTATTG